MTSVLRNLQAQWNELVPAAQARGIRRVRMLNAPLETIQYRRTKLEWLRAQLGTSSDFDSLTFGVEIEFMMPRQGLTQYMLADDLIAAGVETRVEDYGHAVRSTWKIVTDGSLGDYARGRELVSPVLSGERGFDQLRKACDILKSKGCKVNVRCGLHVHVGARNQPVDFFRNLVNLYASAEGAIDSFMAPSRRGPMGGNGFCRSLRVRQQSVLQSAATLDEVAASIGQTAGERNVRGSGRYCKLNLQSYWQHGTVEFRHHQGTVEAVKAENWVRLCLRMVRAAQLGPKVATTVQELMEAVEAGQAEKDYFEGRVRFFRPDPFTVYGDSDMNLARRRA